MAEIIIIGAGITGLTTALTLQRAGYQTKIITKDYGINSASGVSAALWKPYEANPPERVLKWARHAYGVFQQEVMRPESGVLPIVAHNVLRKSFEKPFWHDVVEDGTLLKQEGSENDNVLGLYRFKTFVSDMSYYLPYLQKQYIDDGGTIELQQIKHIDECFAQGLVVINCTGMGSKLLADDKSMYPIRGVVLIASKTMNENWSDTQDPAYMAYVIPRRDVMIMGGTHDDHDTRPEATQEEIDGIIKRCHALCPQTKNAEILGVKVGFRPMRPEIRLEAETLGGDKYIIHNYGHGGSGPTLSWGCAQEVLELVRAKA
ncbi:MAG: FAD-dependent oxidoreductase [Alphaproteobacteria bacterium]|nr:FAD-dependent oxidoreductase [Alphaproteobacteria bacterium]